MYINKIVPDNQQQKINVSCDVQSYFEWIIFHLFDLGLTVANSFKPLILKIFSSAIFDNTTDYKLRYYLYFNNFVLFFLPIPPLPPRA